MLHELTFVEKMQIYTQMSKAALMEIAEREAKRLQVRGVRWNQSKVEIACFIIRVTK